MVLLVVGLKAVSARRVLPLAQSRFQQRSCGNSRASARIRDAGAESIN
jgi:hypothetical protein